VNNYYNNTYSDLKYDRGFIHGYRIGRINATREILIRILRDHGEVSKKIIRKINNETDLGFMDIMIEYALGCLHESNGCPSKQNKNLDTIEASYDKLSRTEQEFIDEKYCIYNKSHSSDRD
jgi:hypothetical protein